MAILLILWSLPRSGVEAKEPNGATGEEALGEFAKPDLEPGGLRRLAQTLVDVPGIKLTEADYDARVVRVGLDPALGEADRERVSTALGSTPGVLGVRSE